jgi:hypothetical protein
MDIDAKRLADLLDRQAKTLERIAVAAERSNQLLYELLSPTQHESLSKKDHARLTASHTKPRS